MKAVLFVGIATMLGVVAATMTSSERLRFVGNGRQGSRHYPFSRFGKYDHHGIAGHGGIFMGTVNSVGNIMEVAMVEPRITRDDFETMAAVGMQAGKDGDMVILLEDVEIPMNQGMMAPVANIII